MLVKTKFKLNEESYLVNRAGQFKRYKKLNYEPKK